MNTFSLSAWILQSITLFLGILAAIPILRALIGISLVAISEMFGLKTKTLRTLGIKIVPAFLRASLGFGLVIGMATPANAETIENQIPIIDRVIDFEESIEETIVIEEITPTENVASEVDSRAKKSSGIEIYKIKAGDSLWTIAQDQVVGNGATANEIDTAWREIWRLNRDVIGDNPSLIKPGQEIRLNDFNK